LRWLLCLLTLWLVSLSVETVCAADPVFPQDGPVGAVVPRGMSPAVGFACFQDNARGAALFMMTAPPGSYAETVAAYADNGKLAQYGVLAERREKWTIGSNPALVIIGRQQAASGSVRKWIALVDSPKAVALVTMQYTDAAAATYTDAVVRTMLASIVIRDPPNLERQIAALPYTVPSLGPFRIISGIFMGNMLLLTDGPKDTDPEHDQASLAIGMTTSNPAPRDRDDFGRSQFLGLTAVRVSQIDVVNHLTIYGFPVLEILGSGATKTGTPLKLAQWTVFGPSSTLILLAMARPVHFNQVYPDLVALRNGIHPK
jgi:hypothetical protein